MTSDLKLLQRKHQIMPTYLCPAALMRTIQFRRRKGTNLRVVGMANNRWRLIPLYPVINVCHPSFSFSSSDSNSCIVKNILKCTEWEHCKTKIEAVVDCKPNTFGFSSLCECKQTVRHPYIRMENYSERGAGDWGSQHSYNSRELIHWHVICGGLFLHSVSYHMTDTPFHVIHH